MLLTRAPLYRGRSPFSLDLHVLGAPLTFVLSQDQTLQFESCRLAVRLEADPLPFFFTFDVALSLRVEGGARRGTRDVFRRFS